jgi:hypothetical protein
MPAVIDYVFEEPATCPNCKKDIVNKMNAMIILGLPPEKQHAGNFKKEWHSHPQPSPGIES